MFSNVTRSSRSNVTSTNRDRGVGRAGVFGTFAIQLYFLVALLPFYIVSPPNRNSYAVLDKRARIGTELAFDTRFNDSLDSLAPK